jgi:hypothetical protein
LTSDGRLPLDEQLARFEETLRRNRTLTEVLTQAAGLDLPGWYLVAGCLCQTVWNVVSGQPPEAGILDYGLSDAFNLVVRPNPVLAPPGVYRAKTERWQRQWPALTVLPWPG